MKIIIELPTWLGDTLMATPAIENVNFYFQNPEITLLGSRVSIEALKNHPNVKKTYVLEKNYFKLYKNIKCLNEFDFYFSFRSSLRSKFIKFFVLAKRKYQFNKFFYNDGHQVEKYNNFINDSLEIKTSPKKLLLHNLSYKKKVDRKILGINPGASYGSSKRWYPERFSQVATELSSNYDIVIFGADTEEAIANDIEKYLLANGVFNYQNLVGKTSIEELINEISKLDLLITGDSGPMHLAAALEISTVSIFGPTNDKETSQWMNEKSLIVKKNLICQPCMKRTCPLKHHNCMNQIKAADVLEAIDSLS
jgi:heptosyltransferase II